jgi:hypothetical protein
LIDTRSPSPTTIASGRQYVLGRNLLPWHNESPSSASSASGRSSRMVRESGRVIPEQPDRFALIDMPISGRMLAVPSRSRNLDLSMKAIWLTLFVVAALGPLCLSQAQPDEPDKTPAAAADARHGKEPGEVRDDNCLKTKLVWCPLARISRRCVAVRANVTRIRTP